MKGTSFLGYDRSAAASSGFSVKNRTGGDPLEETFFRVTEREVDQAVRLAATAFPAYRDLDRKQRAEFLRAIAANLEKVKDEIVARAMAESALPEARLTGELGRTCAQLRMFATIAEEGSWVDVRIDPAQPDRKPLPAPDTRSMLRPLGPVAVFGASNFPLAFSVAGGDTASALAAGCPVVVKAHPAHPGTSELAADAIVEAAKQTGMPAGVFSMVFDDGLKAGEALVRHPLIKAVGFTGSRSGGLAIWRLVNQRVEPIPVFAEMGSINPVVVLPGKLDAALAAALHASATVGVGQFCTNPGLVITVGQADTFREAFVSKMAGTPRGTMLTEAIGANYLEGVRTLRNDAHALLMPTHPGSPAVFIVDAPTFVGRPGLQVEVFGPCTLLVSCKDKREAVQVINRLEGQLTGSIHGSDDELASAGDLVAALEGKVGRLIVNQFPTGLEVNSSIVHGGPFPATTDSRMTSVGGRAILRWARPVCYQNFPTALLPEELRG